MSDEKKKEEQLDQSVIQKLFKNRIATLSGQINMDSANVLMSTLYAMDSESSDPITLYINSPGGEVYSGFAIYDCIRQLRSKVRIVVCGLAASAATLVLVSVPKEQRYSLPHSYFLIHQPLGEFEGRAIEIQIYMKHGKKLRDELTRCLADGCGQDFDKVYKDTERDNWMDAQEANAYGLVGTIVTKTEEIL